MRRNNITYKIPLRGAKENAKGLQLSDAAKKIVDNKCLREQLMCFEIKKGPPLYSIFHACVTQKAIKELIQQHHTPCITPVFECVIGTTCVLSTHEVIDKKQMHALYDRIGYMNLIHCGVEDGLCTTVLPPYSNDTQQALESYATYGQSHTFISALPNATIVFPFQPKIFYGSVTFYIERGYLVFTVIYDTQTRTFVAPPHPMAYPRDSTYWKTHTEYHVAVQIDVNQPQYNDVANTICIALSLGDSFPTSYQTAQLLIREHTIHYQQKSNEPVEESYPVKTSTNCTYQEFISCVKNPLACCAIIIRDRVHLTNEYHQPSPQILDKQSKMDELYTTLRMLCPLSAKSVESNEIDAFKRGSITSFFIMSPIPLQSETLEYIYHHLPYKPVEDVHAYRYNYNDLIYTITDVIYKAIQLFYDEAYIDTVMSNNVIAPISREHLAAIDELLCVLCSELYQHILVHTNKK